VHVTNSKIRTSEPRIKHHLTLHAPPPRIAEGNNRGHSSCESTASECKIEDTYKQHRHGMGDRLTTTVGRADSFRATCMAGKK
jgi:hypothetical protein